MRYVHAKLAADIVNLAQKSRHDVYLVKGKIRIDAKSILGVMSLVSLDDVVIETEDHEIALLLEAVLWS